MESESAVVALGFDCMLVSINNSPSLVPSVMFLPDNDLSSFFILVSMNIECFVVSDVGEVFSSVDEDLPPS
jgi:hypothetical protein